MPTTIDSAGITFNDTTSLTSANIGTAQLVNGSVIASKLGTNEQKQIAKAWVNFNGTFISTASTAANALNLSVISGNSTGTWSSSTAFDVSWNGQIFFINSIAGVSGATFGGLNVATVGFQITSISGTSATVRFLAGTATSSQTIIGTNSGSTGYIFSTSGIRSSYNVSSVTKNGTGDYTVNFTTPMADANYSLSGMCNCIFGATIGLAPENSATTVTTKTTSAFRVITRNWGSSAFDMSDISISVFGN